MNYIHIFYYLLACYILNNLFYMYILYLFTNFLISLGYVTLYQFMLGY